VEQSGESRDSGAADLFDDPRLVIKVLEQPLQLPLLEDQGKHNGRDDEAADPKGQDPGPINLQVVSQDQEEHANEEKGQCCDNGP